MNCDCKLMDVNNWSAEFKKKVGQIILTIKSLSVLKCKSRNKSLCVEEILSEFSVFVFKLWKHQNSSEIDHEFNHRISNNWKPEGIKYYVFA